MLAAGQNRHCLRRRLLLLQLRDQQLNRVLPGNRLVLPGPARAGQLERALNAIGMVERLHRRLAARARAAHADRVLGIAFNLLGHHGLDALFLAVDRADRLALHHADEDAAARRARLADRMHPAFFVRHEFVRRDEQRDQLLRLAAAVEDEAGRRPPSARFSGTRVSSFVTRQAIVADLVFAMAVDALAHRPVHALARVGGVLLIAVARLARRRSP